MRNKSFIGIAAALAALGSSAQASTTGLIISTPVNQVYFTASSYRANSLMANTIYNGFTYQNYGNPVRLYFLGRSGNRYYFELDVFNVAPGAWVQSIVRNNATGALAYSERKYVSSANGVYSLGSVSL